MHFVAVAQLKGAPIRSAAVALGAIRGFTVAINGIRLLTGRADNGF